MSPMSPVKGCQCRTEDYALRSYRYVLVSTSSTNGGSGAAAPGGGLGAQLVGVGAGPIRVTGIEGSGERLQRVAASCLGSVAALECLHGKILDGEPAAGRFSGQTLSQV